MNILYISSKRGWGGVTTWMEKTAIGLIKRGHKVLIISHPASSFSRNCDKSLKIIEKKLGFDFNPFTILYLINLIKKNKIDIVITNIKKEVIFGGIAARLAKIPNVRRIGLEIDWDNNTIKRLYPFVSYTIAPCKYMVENILKRHKFISPENITFSYNGEDIKQFTQKKINEIKEKYNIPKNKLIIGMTCQLSRTKNVEGVIRVFKKLTKKYEDILLVIAGDGKEKENLLNLANSLVLQDKIVFLGFVKNPQELAATYDIGILFSNLEGFSNSVVEYMALGVPVICTNVGGQKEIVKNNYNGFLIPAGDETMLEDKLSLLISDENLRKKFSLNGIKDVQKNFSEKQMIEKVENLLIKVCNTANA